MAVNDVATTELKLRLGGDLDRLTDAVTALAEVNSGSYNPDGVNRCGERLAELLADLNPDRTEAIDVAPALVFGPDGQRNEASVGRAVRSTKRPDAPFQVCFFGHVDTVFPAESSFQSVSRDGTMLRGPGVADCKGGLVLAIEALRYLDTVDWGQQVGWQFLALSDEEIGSASSLGLLDEAAANHHLGLGFEPALPSGGVAGARKGTVTAHTIVSGKASHVGRAHHEGRSAILALARFIQRVEALNEREGVTVSTGRISGGGPLNVVPDFAIGSYNMRVETTEDRDWVKAEFEKAASELQADTETTLALTWAGERPPKVRTSEIDQLLSDVGAAAEALGFAMPAEDTGGCCDGNNLAAAGLPNVDSLGIAGGGIHSSDEFADVASIANRAPVVAEVVRRALIRHSSERPDAEGKPR